MREFVFAGLLISPFVKFALIAGVLFLPIRLVLVHLHFDQVVLAPGSRRRRDRICASSPPSTCSCEPMFNRARRVFRVILTSLLVLAAVVAVWGLWTHYMVSPWTRDGQVRVQVAQIAPQVAGQITELHARDNQFVRKGDLLYVIDKIDYKIALDMANADVSSKKAELEVKQQQNARRQALTTLSTSIEE